MAKVFNNVGELIGKTPILQLHNLEKLNKTEGHIFAKLEYFNPAGSIKDRVAENMLREAFESGEITKKSVIIEPTSGNTGIGLAMLCAGYGMRAIIVMPDNMSVERQLLMRAYGAEVVLTDGKKGMSGAIAKAEELCQKIPDAFIPGQFINEANPTAHRLTTGPEIYEDMQGRVDILVCGVGTGGTITGTGEFLKSKNPELKIVAIEPASSAVLSGESAGAHKIAGIGAGFVPEILNTEIYDEIITVSDEGAVEMARAVAVAEGVLVGISSGAALCGAIEVAKREENRDKNIVVILPDGGERYLSAGLVEK